MARIDALRSKLDKVLKTFNPVPGTVYKRVTTRTGGDPVTGRGYTVTTTDTALLVPPIIQPVTSMYSQSALDSILVTGSSVNPVTDLVCTVSANALSMAELQNKDLTLVVKTSFPLTTWDDQSRSWSQATGTWDQSGIYEETFSIVSYWPAALYGSILSFDILIRSRKRAEG